MSDEFKKSDDMHGFSFGSDSRKEEEKEIRQDRDDPYANVRKESEPYSFGPFSGTTSYPSENRSSFGGTTPYQPENRSPLAEPPRTDITPVAREYRPFTVSGSGRGGSWPAPKKTSFRSMFAAFMTGVVALGALMFAADRGNWFSASDLLGTQPSQTTSAKTVSNPVSNAADVVRPNNIAKIFEQSSPAVVQINTKVAANNRNSEMDDFFRQFFGDDTPRSNGGGNGGGELQPGGMGSGFFFDSTGYILTNQHVVADADEIEVTVIGHNKPFKAKLLGSSYELDLAVLKIEGSNFPTLKLGDSTSTNMGDWVVAIGNPYGFDHTVTVGVLSSNERKISIPDQNGTRNYEHLLQTDASINPGNSGGPLLNLNGEVIGINTAVSAQAQGIGFAIPTSTISEVLDNLKNNVKIPKKPVPFIGANLYTLTADMAERLGLKGTTGSLVESVVYGSPAYKGDLRAYDVITGMDGTPYKDNSELVAAIQKKNIGDKVTLNVIRNDQKIDVVVTIGNKNDFEEQQQQQQ